MLASQLESDVRALVAQQLGVDEDALTPDVSLIDDLAADSLDLVELSLAVERALGVVLPRRVLDEVRTCGDLVEAILASTRGRRRRAAPAAARPALVRARISSATSPGGWSLERVFAVTPYALESIAEDALAAGPDARVEVTLVHGGEDALDPVRRALAPLGGRGVEIVLRQDPRAERRTSTG